MVILVNVARFELKPHKPVKRILAFILSVLIGRKGCLPVLLCAGVLLSLLYFNFLHWSAVGCDQLSRITLGYNVLNVTAVGV